MTQSAKLYVPRLWPAPASATTYYRHMHARHKNNKKAVQEPARQAKLSPKPEVPNLMGDTNGRPADTGI